MTGPATAGPSAQPGRTVADCVTDVRAIAEALGFARCAVWGFSGGGPHALACGALADDLVAAVATIGSPAPPDAPGLDYFAGMPDDARQDHALFTTDRAEWERVSAQQCEAALARSHTEFVDAWSAGKAPVDHAALRGDFGTWLDRAVRTGIAPVIDGALDDNIAIFYAPGVSSRRRSPSRSRSGTAPRTASLPPPTAGGSPSTSPAPRPTSTTRTGT